LASRRARYREHGTDIMKKTPKRKSGETTDLREEYRFDYGQAKPNRFAAALKGSAMAVRKCAIASIKECGGASLKHQRRPSRST
jgi:hypothetical protein